ncbi:glycoside hydrolase family 3 protein, partial [Phanerochaete carnosa HHB-10118-sp]
YYQCLPGAATSSVLSNPSSTIASQSSSSSSSGGASSSSTSLAPPSQTSVANVSPEWAAAYQKAQAAITKLSVTDMVNLGTGVQWQKGPCVGNTPAISSIPGFNGLCLQDSPVGVRYADGVSVFPPEINVAATWNRTLMQQRGAAMGAEFKGKGVNVGLGPMMNLMRVPAAGRNWEGGGGDPYLSGEVAFETITGIQSSGVQACAKHFINNEQEHFRDSSSSNVDDSFICAFLNLTFHDSSSAAFQANVAAVMCSYINGSFACENEQTLSGLLKGEYGFQGSYCCMETTKSWPTGLSDWWATHSGAPAVNAGLDMTMPGDESENSGTTYFGQNLVNVVNSGEVSQARIQDLATRVLAAWYLLGQDQNYPAVNFNSWNSGEGQHVNVSGDHASLIRTIGAASQILLKNTNGALALNKPKSIGIIGKDAGSNPSGPNACTDRSCDIGILALGWGSGTANFPYLVAPVDAITARAAQDGTAVSS